MNNNLQVFKSEEFGQVRTIVKNNEIWFVGKDIAKILGYSDTSATVSKKVDSEDKIKEIIPHCQNGKVVKTQTTLVNESGLYSLILGSKIPSSKKFKRWVTNDVLPSIRKHGMYATEDRKSTRLNSSHANISYAVFCLKKKKIRQKH